MNAARTSLDHRPDPSLTDRYVHATMRAVPQDRRDDLGAELRSTVDDMVQARVEAGQSPHQAEHDALVELGDPSVLAARYTQAPLHLLGPTYYLVWKRLLRQLLTWIPALIGTIAAVVTALERGTTVGDVVASALLTAAGTAIQICFWLTLVFVFIDRVAGDAEVPEWTPDLLPDVPAERDPSFGDAAAAITFSLVLAGALVVQHFRSFVDGGDGQDVPILDPGLWQSWLPLLLALLVVDVALEVWKYRAGWSAPVVAATIVVGAAFWVPVAWLAGSERLLNPAFLDAVGLSAGYRDDLGLVIAVSGVLVGLWEAGDALLRRSRLRDPAGR